MTTNSASMGYAVATKRASVALVASLLLPLVTAACSKANDPGPPARAYRMGFSHIPPRLTIPDVITTLDKWEPRGDAAVLLASPAWKAILADTSPSVIIRREYLEIIKRYRTKKFMVVVMFDATDGFDRSKENAELVALGRSIAEPEIQALYREWAMAIDTILRPDYLGVAMETNLIRAVAPPTLYANVKTMVNATAAALEARGTPAKLFVSVQVEVAWGKLAGTGSFVGIDQDRTDYPFMDALGLSSYPNLTTVAEPEDLALDYYQKLDPAGTLPMLVVEGGWSSATIVHPATPQMQARYIRRQMHIADRANVAFMSQLTFADIDVATFPEQEAQLTPFASMGLVTPQFADKPALAEWDAVFARKLRSQ